MSKNDKNEFTKKFFSYFFSPRNKEKKMVCAFDIIRQISDLVVEKFAEEEFVEEEEEGHIEFISPRPTYDEILNSEAFTDAEDMLNEFEEEPTTARFFWVSVNDIVLDRFNEEEIHYRIHEKRFWYSVINHFFEDEKEYTGGISSEDFIEYWRYYLQMI